MITNSRGRPPLLNTTVAHQTNPYELSLFNIKEILTKQTKNNAIGNGNRNPERILRNIEPGIAND